MKCAMSKEYPPKVLAMYQAVIKLLNQGWDIHELKVADITREAGIGKGTAYEYFSSKEEILAGALVYEANQMVESLCRLQSREEQFEKKLQVILQWIGNDFKESRVFERMMKLENGKDESSHVIQENVRKMKQSCESYVAVLDELLEIGRQQGVVKEPNNYAARMAVISQIFSVLMYLRDKELQKELSVDEIVDIAYRNIMKLLG